MKLHDIYDESYIVKIFGITRDDTTKEYAIVMKYSEYGDLKYIIQEKNKPLKWYKKLCTLSSTANLMCIVLE